MSFLAYWYLLRENINHFLHIRKTVIDTKVKAKYLQEIVTDKQQSLAKKCRKSAVEIKHISQFHHWPITKSKSKKEHNHLIYLNINTTKNSTKTKSSSLANNNIIAIKQVVFTTKKATIKKLT